MIKNTLYLSCIAVTTGPVVELDPVTATLSSTAISTYGALGADHCIDNNTVPVDTLPHGGICSTLPNNDATPWIAIDFDTRVIVERVEIFNTVNCCGD